MEWQYEKPANDTKKPLVSSEGFEAMHLSLCECKAGFVLYISIPPPRQDDTVSQLSHHILLYALITFFYQTWDTGEGDHVEKPYDYYEETSTAPEENSSAKAQIVSASYSRS